MGFVIPKPQRLQKQPQPVKSFNFTPQEGETLVDSLARELREELSVELSKWSPFFRIDYDYRSFFLRMFTFTCTVSGLPSLNEHLEAKWVSLHYLDTLNLAPVDILVARELAARSKVTVDSG